jgi:hypothetical protein
VKVVQGLTLWENCVHNDHTNLQVYVHINYITTRLQHWKMINCTCVLKKFQRYGIFWTYFGQLYNFGDQCVLTFCFSCFIVVICNLGTQMQLCRLQSPYTNTDNVGNANNWHGRYCAICMVIVLTPCATTLQL